MEASLNSACTQSDSKHVKRVGWKSLSVLQSTSGGKWEKDFFLFSFEMEAKLKQLLKFSSGKKNFVTPSLKIEFISKVSRLSYIILEMIFLLCRAADWKLLNVMRRNRWKEVGEEIG